MIFIIEILLFGKDRCVCIFIVSEKHKKDKMIM